MFQTLFYFFGFNLFMMLFLRQLSMEIRALLKLLMAYRIKKIRSSVEIMLEYVADEKKREEIRLYLPAIKTLGGWVAAEKRLREILNLSKQGGPNVQFN